MKHERVEEERCKASCGSRRRRQVIISLHEKYPSQAQGGIAGFKKNKGVRALFFILGDKQFQARGKKVKKKEKIRNRTTWWMNAAHKRKDPIRAIVFTGAAHFLHYAELLHLRHRFHPGTASTLQGGDHTHSIHLGAQDNSFLSRRYLGQGLPSRPDTPFVWALA